MTLRPPLHRARAHRFLGLAYRAADRNRALRRGAAGRLLRGHVLRDAVGGEEVGAWVRRRRVLRRRAII